jgi:hypothetical protein
LGMFIIDATAEDFGHVHSQHFSISICDSSIS